jgi:6-phosphogluconolactonase (cycloisomerase 2 family)
VALDGSCVSARTALPETGIFRYFAFDAESQTIYVALQDSSTGRYTIYTIDYKTAKIINAVEVDYDAIISMSVVYK